MNDNPNFYKPDTAINPSKLILAIIIGLVASLLLAYLYNLLSTFIPIIYFNVLITIGFGLALGIASRLVGRITKLANKRCRLVLAVVIAISAFLFQWIAYIETFRIGYAPSFTDYLMDIPIAFMSSKNWSILGELYSYGSWTIGGIIFNKLLLLLVWLVEMGMIIFIPVASVLKAPQYPYSNTMGKWFPKYTLSDQFESISSKGYFLNDYHRDLRKGIQNLKMGDGWRHGKVHVYYLEEENDAFFSFEKVFVEGRGKGKKTSNMLIENLRLTRQEAKSILADFYHEKEKFNLF